MKNRFHANQILLIYEAVMRCGQRTEQGSCWQGITAYSSLDGYEIYLASDDGVLLVLGFHNTYQLKYERRHQLEAFEKRLSGLLNRNRMLERAG